MISVGIVILPSDRWAQAREQWEWAEEAGFLRAYTYDHVRWGGLPAGPWHAAYPVLAAAAGVTTRMRLGTLVTSPNFRHPVPLAREIVTIDDLSSGRFDLGIGAGSVGFDATVMGQHPWDSAERARRFAEFIELLDLLLTSPESTWSGKYYEAVEAPTTPGCVQSPRVPFSIAAAGRSSLQVAARFAQRWVTVGPTGPGPRDADTVLSFVTRQNEALSAACLAAGRDPSSIGRVFLAADPGLQPDSLAGFVSFARPYEDLGFDEIVVHHPQQTGPFGGSMPTLMEISEKFNR